MIAPQRELDDGTREIKSRRDQPFSDKTLLPCEHREDIYHLGSGTFPDTQSADNLILSFSPSRTDRNNFLLFTAHLLQSILV